MGINVQRYFALAWALTGVVSALGGVIWGAMLGVDNQLPLVGLKVFPVVILGGLDSIVGAVVGGLIVGVVEALGRGLSGSDGRRRHQGFRALCADDPDADVPARTACSATAGSSACDADRMSLPAKRSDETAMAPTRRLLPALPLSRRMTMATGRR